MNTVSQHPFTHPLRGIAQYLLAALAALAAALASGILLQGINPFPPKPDPMFFRLLVGSALVLGPALLYFLQESRFHGPKLLGLTLAVYIGSAQAMAHIETVAFNFLFRFSPAELLFVIVNQAVTALILVPLVITVAGKWKAPADLPEDRTAGWLPAVSVGFGGRMAVLAVLWYGCYMLAGFFIADPVTHGYYAAKIDDFNGINAWLPFLQLFRGVLWTLLFLLAVRVANRPLTEAGLVVGLLFGVFHAAGLLVPNAFMPAEMRLSHLPEIVLSLVLMGSLVVGVFGWRKKVR